MRERRPRAAPAAAIGDIRRRGRKRPENRAANVATGWECGVGVTPVSRATTTLTQRWVGPLSDPCWDLRREMVGVGIVILVASFLLFFIYL